MIVIASLVGVALTVIVGTVGWSWTSGTLRETDEDRVDHEFFRIVHRIRPGEGEQRRR
jgi:hypothetical protein